MSIVQSIFPRLLQEFFLEEDTSSENNYRVPYFTTSYDKEHETFELKIEIPGLRKEDIVLKSTDKTIFFSTRTYEEEKSQPIKYQREFQFRTKIRPETIKAHYNDGILTLKVERDLPKKIDIQIA